MKSTLILALLCIFIGNLLEFVHAESKILSRIHRQVQPEQPPQGSTVYYEGFECHNNDDRECNIQSTFLKCDQGICFCPYSELEYKRGPYPVDTKWNLDKQRCEAVNNSVCDSANPIQLHCQEGLECIGEKGRYVGFCQEPTPPPEPETPPVIAGTNQGQTSSKPSESNGVGMKLSVISIISISAISVVLLT